MSSTGDLNNTSAMRAHVNLEPDPAYEGASFSLQGGENESEIRRSYRPFILEDKIATSDWISKLELSTAFKTVEQSIRSGEERLRVLVLYGSLRQRFIEAGNDYSDKTNVS